MADNWKPGDRARAIVTTRGANLRTVQRVDNSSHPWRVMDELGGIVSGSVVEVACRVESEVSIDPEDREGAERLARAHHAAEYVATWGDLHEKTRLGLVDQMQAALREFANPAPPKPDEPTGHLAVVIDTNGNRWINWRDLRDDMDHERPWVLASDGFTYRDYADIDVAEIKWEGIQ